MPLNYAEVHSIWSVPDMTVINAGRRDPVAMPSEIFGPAWPNLRAIAEGTSTPVDYPGLAYLVCCASLIGGKRRVRPYSTSPWAEPCILWGAVVGDPSARKSPALDAVTDRLRAIEQDHAEAYKDDLRRYREDAERAKLSRNNWEKQVEKAVKEGASTPRMPDDAVEPEEPHRRRTLVGDATPEAVAAILSGNPMGTLHFRDELAGWLTSFDRYSPGGREFWLESYGGRGFTVDRKGAKQPITIPFNGVSVLGGIQPAKLASALLSSPDDGLVARFLWAWPNKVPFSRPRAVANINDLESIYRRLEGLEWGRDSEGRQCAIVLPLSATAADIFERWQEDNAAVDDEAGDLFKSFVGKMDGTVLRLALVCELAGWACRGGAEPVEVSEDSLIAAATWVDDYAKPMAERVYGDAALPVVERHAATLARYIRKAKLGQVNKRDLRRSPHKSNLAGIRDADALEAALRFLVDAGWLLKNPSRDGGGHGRQSEDYLVNPAVLGG